MDGEILVSCPMNVQFIRVSCGRGGFCLSPCFPSEDKAFDDGLISDSRAGYQIIRWNTRSDSYDGKKIRKELEKA